MPQSLPVGSGGQETFFNFLLEDDRLFRRACDGKRARAVARGPLQYSPLHLLGKGGTSRSSTNRVRKRLR